MRAKLMLTLAAAAAAIVAPPAIDAVRAQGPAALTGIVSSEAEGKMEGVVVTARRAKSIVQVSGTTDASGRYAFPRDRLEPGEYTLSIRAVGYDIESPGKATVNGKARAISQIGRLARDHQLERGRPMAVPTEDAAASQGPRHSRDRHPVRRRAADERAARRAGR